MMVRLFAVLAVSTLLAWTPAASAQTPAAPAAVTAPAPAAAIAAPRPALPAAAPPQAAASAGSLLQTIFGLTVVLGLLALFAWGMKRFGPRHPAGEAGLRIVGALNLGGRERIMVVEVGDQWIVVGASPGRVNALASMPKQEGAATLAPHAPAASSFADWLKQTIDKRNAN
jgi:flagellar protein FliO/FliZ